MFEITPIQRSTILGSSPWVHLTSGSPTTSCCRWAEKRYQHLHQRTGIGDLEDGAADFETDLSAPGKELLHVGLGEVDTQSIVVGLLLDHGESRGLLEVGADVAVFGSSLVDVGSHIDIADKRAPGLGLDVKLRNDQAHCRLPSHQESSDRQSRLVD